MAGDLIEELVHQFTDPFAFYRELIQNSIDAGSARIEVVLSYRPEGAKGLLTAKVADFGEGMNRRVIEDYLLTKFRSSKENDLTKIGKFGIGFVSVFACAPDAVVVDTGRDGEFWRVLFKKDRSYELLQLREPVEGTSVTLHKALTPSDYDAFAAASKESVQRWCRHSEADVAFAAGGHDGSPPPPPSPVKEPLEVDAPFQVEHLEEGTHVVAGPSRRDPAPTGMYNRGLTLLESTEPLVPGVAVKIVSRWLEHTLTRDNVRRDRNFDRVLALVRRLVDGPLLQRLPSELKAAAEAKHRARDWQVLLAFAAHRLPAEQLWFRQPGGGALPYAAVAGFARAHGAAVVSPEVTPLVARMGAASMPVVEGGPEDVGTWVQAVVLPRRKDTPALLADQAFTYAEPPEAGAPEAFCGALAQALATVGAQTRQVAVAEVRGASGLRPSVRLEALGRPLDAARAETSAWDPDGPPLLCLNVVHPRIARAAPLMHRAPRLAALLVARQLAVTAGRLPAGADARLTEWGLR